MCSVEHPNVWVFFVLIIGRESYSKVSICALFFLVLGCTTYDCKVPGGQCGMNSNFCKMFPAQFLIDYVRVYQNKNDSRQTVGMLLFVSVFPTDCCFGFVVSCLLLLRLVQRDYWSKKYMWFRGLSAASRWFVTICICNLCNPSCSISRDHVCLHSWSASYPFTGCNPRDYPTRKFIAGHEYRYKRPQDRHPLKSIVTGAYCGRLRVILIVVCNAVGSSLPCCCMVSYVLTRFWVVSDYDKYVLYCHHRRLIYIDMLVFIFFLSPLQAVPSALMIAIVVKGCVQLGNANAILIGRDRGVW